MSWTRCVTPFAATAVAAALALGLGPATASAQVSAAPDAGGQLLQASAPAPAPAPAPPLAAGVAALVNDDVVSTYDLRQRTLLLILTSGVAPTAENLPQLQAEALRSLVDERLEMQELRKMEKEQKFEIIADDQEVNQALDQIAKENNSSVKEMAAQFARAGLGLQTLKEQIRVQISWNRMISGRYGTRVRIGDNQVEQVLERMKETANQPQYQVSEIFIDAARAGGMSQAVDGANQLIAQIQQGAPFAPVARQFSSAPDAANGGDMGWVSASELQPELAAAVQQMQPGQVSQPIQVSDGVYVLQLKSKRAAGGSTIVSLKQAALRLPKDATQADLDAAAKTLMTFRSSGVTCADLESKAANVSGLVAGDLGTSDVNDLAPEFKTAAESLPVGQMSEPIRTPVGLHLIMVCDRKSGEINLPSKQQVENRLHGEQLSMLSRRYLRDLRNSATIETP
jgi:peptidyl-prolyl cis-trans isomerase SurA